MQLQAKFSCWSFYCGIISFNSDIKIENQHISTNPRIILVLVTHLNHAFEPFYVLNLYAPAKNTQLRNEFFREVLQLPIFKATENPTFETELGYTSRGHTTYAYTLKPEYARMLMGGDLNYFHYHNHAVTLPNEIQRQRYIDPEWIDMIYTQFKDTINHMHIMENNLINRDAIMPTYTQRGTGSRTTIDYIFATPTLFEHVHDPDIAYIAENWTDHCLVSIQLGIRSYTTGKGLYRINPQLLQNNIFCDALKALLDQHAEDIPQILGDEYYLTPQQKWEDIKYDIRRLALKTSRKYVHWRKKQLKSLFSKRNKILRLYRKTPNILHQVLPPVEILIGNLQQEIAETYIIRAGRRWREKGEISAGYLKRTIEQRNNQRYIEQIKDPVTGTVYRTVQEIQESAQEFYQHLYTPEPIDPLICDDLLTAIPDSEKLTTQESVDMMSPFELETIIEGSARCPKQSSPGPDGFCYELLHSVFRHRGIQPLIVRLYNDALQKSIMPKSWNETCMVLLPKKGDLSLWKNYRPIALINTDAKIFSRLLSSRVIKVMSKYLCKYQSGFLPGRFIADNGLTVQLAIDHSRQFIPQSEQRDDVGLLIDQEKAYDKVHPGYLRRVLETFGFHNSMITCIEQLFFQTEIQININGFLSEGIKQRRGLRQGDPLSPILFNIAFDPFLKSLVSNTEFIGYQFQLSDTINPEEPSIQSIVQAPPPLKLLAYADDVVVFCKTSSDFDIFMEVYQKYSLASNATLNCNKTVAFALNGLPTESWISHLFQHQINTWHSNKDKDPIIYLGYPLYFSITQRDNHIDALIQKISRAAQIHQQRNLSLRGRATVINTLILSKLWHVFRVLPIPKIALNRFQSLVSSFMNHHIWPSVAKDTFQLHRFQGGISILNLDAQLKNLQWRWLCPLLTDQLDSTSTKFSATLYIKYCLQLYCQCTDIRLPLIFKEMRPAAWSNRLSPLTNIYRTMENLEHIFRSFSGPFQTPVNYTTCLQLPLQAIWEPKIYRSSQPAPFHKNPGVFRCIVSDIYRQDPQSKNLRIKNTLELDLNPHPLVTRKFKTVLEKDRLIKLKPFFIQTLTNAELPNRTSTIDATPWITEFNFWLKHTRFHYLDSVKINSLTSKQVKKLLTSSSSNTAPSRNWSRIPYLKWRNFWNLSLHTTARNIWYRLIHNKIPSPKILHQFIPASNPSSDCPRCGIADADAVHMIITCEDSWNIWQHIYTEYLYTAIPNLPNPTSITAVTNSLIKYILRLEFPQLPPQPSNPLFLQPGLILGVTLHATWISLIQNYKHRVPINLTTTLPRILKNISRLQKEDDL